MLNIPTWIKSMPSDRGIIWSGFQIVGHFVSTTALRICMCSPVNSDSHTRGLPPSIYYMKGPLGNLCMAPTKWGMGGSGGGNAWALGIPSMMRKKMGIEKCIVEPFLCLCCVQVGRLPATLLCQHL